jgi:hypothetical protein
VSRTANGSSRSLGVWIDAAVITPADR